MSLVSILGVSQPRMGSGLGVAGIVPGPFRRATRAAAMLVGGFILHVAAVSGPEARARIGVLATPYVLPRAAGGADAV